MRKNIPAIILSALLIMSFAVFTANAMSDPFQTMDEAAGGKNILKFPTYITGGDGFNDAEGSQSILDYENEDVKYCTEQLPYNVEWMYDKAYAAERLLLRTSNDSQGSHRRMGDGWTLSGSNDGKTWTVIYTGKEDDVDNVNFTYFVIDLPENTKSYLYYKLNADTAGSEATQDANKIQLSIIALCVNESVEVPDKAPYVYKPKSLKISSDNAVIEATDFDSGTYNETNAAEGDHNVRPNEEVQTSFCGADYAGREVVSGDDTGCIGWTAAGEWVQYTIRVIKSGVYQIDAWIASGNETPGSVEISYNDVAVGAAQSSNNGRQNYSKVSVGTVEIVSGIHVFKALFPTGAINLNAIEFTRVSDLPSAEVPAAEETTIPADEGNDESSVATVAAASNNSSDDGGSNAIIFIIIGAVGIAIIVAIIIIISKKKK